MLKDEKGQSLVEVLVVLVVTSMMIIALILIILSSLKNAQLAQNQIKATKIAQNTIDTIRTLRDNNQADTIKIEGSSPECFNKLWENDSVSPFYCGTVGIYCYYKLNVAIPPALTTMERILINPANKISLTDDPGFYRQIKVEQANSSEVKIVIEVSWSDSSGDHSSNLETYLTKPNYNCVTS